MKVRGIVVKIKNSHCLVLASDGTYHKVPMSQYKDVRVGSEIEFALNNWHRYVRPALLVASILVIALGIGLFQQTALPPTFAYVSLDINPSVELEVGPDLKVISAHPLNEDAKNLLSHVKISGQLLSASVNSILAEAVHEGYLKPDQKNYVLSTITLEMESAQNIEYEALASQIRSAVENKGVDVELMVVAANNELHKEAKTKGLSTGKLLIYREAVDAGQSVTLQQVKENSITNLVNNYKIKLAPNMKHQNTSDDKQVSAPGQKERGGGVSDEQPGNKEQDNKKDNGNKKKDNGNNKQEKDGNARENDHMPEKDNNTGNSSNNGNGNGKNTRKANNNENTLDLDNKSDSGKSEANQDSANKPNSRQGKKPIGD